MQVKEIIHLFSIYGFDLESGVMVIDEPELHLHPQIQEISRYNLIQLLNTFTIIIATHSPIYQ